ncbi:MAG: Flp family type IVb pilin [Variibacter sp.]
MFVLLERFVRDESGATAVEYAVIAGGIFVAITTVVMNVGSQVAVMYENIGNKLAATN